MMYTPHKRSVMRKAFPCRDIIMHRSAPDISATVHICREDYIERLWSDLSKNRRSPQASSATPWSHHICYRHNTQLKPESCPWGAVTMPTLSSMAPARTGQFRRNWARAWGCWRHRTLSLWIVFEIRFSCPLIAFNVAQNKTKWISNYCHNPALIRWVQVHDTTKKSVICHNLKMKDTFLLIKSFHNI